MKHENMSVAVIKIPEHVKEMGAELAEAHAALFDDLSYERAVTELMCDWAFSEWLVRNRIYHEWDSEFGNEFTCEAMYTGQLIGVKIHSIYAGEDFDPATEGIRTPFYDVHTNTDIDCHVLVRYDGENAYIYGCAAAEHIKQKANIWELRPMILQLEADALPVGADLLLAGLGRTEEEQHPLDGLLD